MPTLHPDNTSNFSYDQIQETSSERTREFAGKRVAGVVGERVKWAAIAVGIAGLITVTYYYFAGFGDEPGRGVKTIAVLPFHNPSGDSSKNYFASGVAEDLLNHLTRISDFNVKSRTSTIAYRATTSTIRDIGKELGVENILRGSALLSEDQITIDVELIDAGKESVLWSKRYDHDHDDIFDVQAQIVFEVARALHANISEETANAIRSPVSDNFAAYDFFLKARDIVNRGPIGWSKEDVKHAMTFINQSLQRDPTFAKATALKGRIWYYSSYWGTHNSVWQDSALFYAARTIETDPLLPEGYKLRGDLYRDLGEYEAAKKDFKKLHEVAPNNPEFLFDYGIQLLRERNKSGADIILRSIYSNYRALDPEYYRQLSDVYYYLGDLQAEIKLLEKAKKLDPGSIGGPLMMAAALVRNGQYHEAIKELNATKSSERWVLDQLGWAYYLNQDFSEAADKWKQMAEIEEEFNDPTQTLPYRHRLGMVYLKMNRKREADSLIEQQLRISSDIVSGKRGMGTWGSLAEAYYDQGICLSYFGRSKEAVQALDSAWHHRFAFYWGWFNDPLLENLRGRSDFESIISQIEEEYGFWRDSFAEALKRAESDEQLREVLGL